MRQQHYQFAHNILRSMVVRDPASTWQRLLSGGVSFLRNLWEEGGRMAGGGRLSSTGLDLHHVKPMEGVEALIVELPTPLEPTECYYVAICMRARKPKEARYFVLEKGVADEGGGERACWAEYRGQTRIRGEDVADISVDGFLNGIAPELRVDDGWGYTPSGPSRPIYQQAGPPQQGSGCAWFLLLLGLAGMAIGAYALSHGFRGDYLDEEAILHGSLLGGAGLIMFAIFLLVKGKKALGIILIIVAIGGIAALFVWRQQQMMEWALEYQARDEMYEQLGEVCEPGEAALDAAAYDGSSGIHPTMIYDIASFGPDYWYDQPDGWEPDSLATAELVACVTSDSQLVQACEYDIYGTLAILNRYQYNTTVQLYEAQTRELLHQVHIPGGLPRECRDVEYFTEGYYTQSVYGSEPAHATIIEHLRPYVEGTAPAGGTGAGVPTTGTGKP